MSRDPLAEYRKRRALERSGEPDGSGQTGSGDRPIFVIQEHDASTHHFDFRIEVGGVLRSWSVPEGPSTDPSERRLAVATENHPLEYADFEGVIPEGEYGAGAVIVWDRGTYESRSEAPIAEALEGGKAELWLEGKKIRGGYALIHAELRGDEDNWLLVKMDDEAADARRNPTSTEPESRRADRRADPLARPRARPGRAARLHRRQRVAQDRPARRSVGRLEAPGLVGPRRPRATGPAGRMTAANPHGGAPSPHPGWSRSCSRVSVEERFQ